MKILDETAYFEVPVWKLPLKMQQILNYMEGQIPAVIRKQFLLKVKLSWRRPIIVLTVNYQILHSVIKKLS